MTTGHGLHLDEGTLVRLLDDELPAEERRAVEAHLAGCSTCREERDEMAALSRAFGGWAAWAEPEEGPPEVALPSAPVTASRGSGRVVGAILRAPAFRAAAALVLLAGVAMAYWPVAQWVEERSGSPATRVEPGPGPGAGAPGSMSVSFLPEGDRVAIRIERSQAAGAIRLDRATGSEVEARVLGGEGAEELTVLPDGLAVGNPADSSAEYVVAVPATVEEVVLSVAGRRVWSGTPGGLPITIPFSADANAPAGEGALR